MVRDCFRIDNDVRKSCILSLWLFNVYMEAMVNEEDGNKEREWLLLVLLFADDLVLCGELEED